MTDLILENGKKNKFMFDLHIFDDAENEEPEQETPPPPPTFDEKEMSDAKSASFEQGHAQGIAESLDSREQKIADLLEKIADETRSLFAEEERREQVFEAEAVHLAYSIFKRLFPLYHQQYGFDELKRVIGGIIKKQEGQTQIQIEVSPTQCAGIEEHLQKLAGHGMDAQKFRVTPNETMAEGACKLSWADGGAARDIQGMADEILAILQDMLAGSPAKGHDDKEHAAQDRMGAARPGPDEDGALSGSPADAEHAADVTDTTMETKHDE